MIAIYQRFKMQTVSEKKAAKVNGFLALFIILVLIVIDIFIFIQGVRTNEPSFLWYFFPLTLIFILGFAGLITVQPNDSRVIIFFGNYTGTVRETGFWWINPFTIKRKVTLRIRNFNSDKISDS